MAKEIQLNILTPDGEIFADKVASIVVQAHLGKLGILYNHAPLFCALQAGETKIKIKMGEKYFSLNQGFLKLKNNVCLIAVESGEPAENINIERATESFERAQKRLNEKDTQTNIERAQASLKRAKLRLETTKKIKQVG